MKMKKLSLLNTNCDPRITNCIGTPVPSSFYDLIRDILDNNNKKEEVKNEKEENVKRV